MRQLCDAKRRMMLCLMPKSYATTYDTARLRSAPGLEAVKLRVQALHGWADCKLVKVTLSRRGKAPLLSHHC